MYTMLTQIKLTNFKCFKEETTIPLSQFNLFTGVNGAGKSTVLQALLLMRQSIEHNPYTTELILNGSCVKLGSFDDVRNREISKKNPIYLEYFYRDDHEKKNKLSMSYHLEPEVDEMSLTIPKIAICLHYLNKKGEEEKVDKHILYNPEVGLRILEGKDFTLAYNGKNMLEFDPNSMRIFELNNPDLGYIAKREKPNEILDYGFEFNSNMDNIHFVSADRIGPQEFYLKSTLSKFRHVGTKGEFAVNLLDKLDQELVDETLCLGEDARTLITQTQAWLGQILNPLKLEVPRSKTNILELFIGDFKPSNVGFGYSSILPIIVTGLIAKPGEKIIIENPEIHLHPKAQSALIEFLVKVANTGVQIFIESHSDHVLNALRVATKSGLLKPEDSSVLFFNTNTVSKANEITSILIDEKGKLHKKTHEGTMAKIPQGFFDEWTNAMAKLF